MRDEQNADAAAGELTHDPKQDVDFVGIEAGGRFVQDQHARRHVDRAGNRNEVLHGNRVIAERCADVDGEPEAAQESGCVPAHDAVAHQPEPRRLSAKEQVFGNVEIGKEIDLLIDGGNARFHCLLGIARHDFHAIEPDGAGIALNDPGDSLDQRRLAGAVLAQQRVDLAGTQLKIDTVKRALPQKTFGQARDFEQRASLFRTRSHIRHFPTAVLEAAPKP